MKLRNQSFFCRQFKLAPNLINEWPVRMLVLALLLLASCTSKAYQPYPQQTGVPLELLALSNKILELKNQQSIESAKFLLNVSLKYGKNFNTFRQGLVFKAPNMFRVETYPLQAGWVSNYFISNGENYVYYDSQENAEEVGAFTEDLFEKYYHIPITLEEILSILRGRPPENWLLDSIKIFSNKNLLSYYTEDQQFFWNADQDNLIQDFLIYKKGSEKVILKGKILNYATFEDQLLPKILQLEVPEYDVKINIRNLQSQIDKEISTDLFVIN